jgi:hypothetical protein
MFGYHSIGGRVAVINIAALGNVSIRAADHNF